MARSLPKKKQQKRDLAFGFTRWIGSKSSLVAHTILFVLAFAAGLVGAAWDTVLLVLTTVVSLEAIYLAIFIQMSVNRNTESLEEVEEDIEEIQEDIDEIQEDVGEIQEDVVEIQEDDKEEELKDKEVRITLETIQTDLHKLLRDIEHLKGLR